MNVLFSYFKRRDQAHQREIVEALRDFKHGVAHVELRIGGLILHYHIPADMSAKDFGSMNVTDRLVMVTTTESGA